MEALVFEAARLVRAALAGWPETIRLCMILLVVAATAVIIMQVL